MESKLWEYTTYWACIKRTLFDNRWFRIHSLPNSKRYADNDEEMQTILDRQNSLIDDLVGENNPYLLLLIVYSDQPRNERVSEIDGTVVLDSVRLDKVAPEYFDYECYLHLSFVNKKWKAGSIDDHLKTVANSGRILDIIDSNSTGLMVVDAEQKSYYRTL